MNTLQEYMNDFNEQVTYVKSNENSLRQQYQGFQYLAVQGGKVLDADSHGPTLEKKLVGKVEKHRPLLIFTIDEFIKISKGEIVF